MITGIEDQTLARFSKGLPAVRIALSLLGMASIIYGVRIAYIGYQQLKIIDRCLAGGPCPYPTSLAVLDPLLANARVEFDVGIPLTVLGVIIVIFAVLFRSQSGKGGAAKTAPGEEEEEELRAEALSDDALSTPLWDQTQDLMAERKAAEWISSIPCARAFFLPSVSCSSSGPACNHSSSSRLSYLRT